MMRINKNHGLILIILTSLVMNGCKKWEDHNAVTDPSLTKNVAEIIAADASVSTFNQLVVKSGYDKILASSKTYTVYSPTNAALANLDPAIIADSAKLKAFVGSHIANQSYFIRDSASMRIPMLNGKYHTLKGSLIDDATVVTANKYAKNGVVHIIDKTLPVLLNTWETLQNNPSIPAQQRDYLLSLYTKVFDPVHAVQIGVNPTTGQPVYQPGTDSITTNLYWNKVYDLRDESKEFSFFILADTAFNTELTKFKPFFATSTIDSTTKLASWEIVKDFAFTGIYKPGAGTDTIISKFNVKVPVESSSIAQTIKTSNGIIYIMKKMDVQKADKIKGFLIEGENYRTTSVDKRSNTYFRDRYNPLTGKDFRDVLVFNHGVALFNINYRISNVYSMKYKAYWVALNDFQTATFSQKLGIGTPASTTFAYTPVTANNFNEVYIGEFTLASFQSFYDLYLVAANSTSSSVNPLVCDYIRLEPSF
jgi:uncharacterized surface protein with fasciclin (FAS1) repeats